MSSALLAQTAHFKPHDLNVKIILCGDLPLEPLEGCTVKLFNLAAPEASQVQMIFLRLYFVVVLFSVEVHKIEFVDQPQPLQQFEGPVDGRTIDVRISLAGPSEQRCRVQVSIRLLDSFNQGASLGCQPNALCFHLVHQRAAF